MDLPVKALDEPGFAMSELRKIKIGISSCLLGRKVRYDGGHKRDRTVTGVLSRYFEFVPVCPEADSGLGVPREPVHLVRPVDGTIRVLGVNDPRIDVTAALTGFSHSRMSGLTAIRGYIVKSKSPSCGLIRVPIHTARGASKSTGRGLFTSILMETFPLLPVVEEGNLPDPVFRKNFLERVRVYDRWRTMLESGLTVPGLIEFHERHEPLIGSRNPAACRKLQRKVSRLRPEDLEASADSYGIELMNALDRNQSREVS